MHLPIALAVLLAAGSAQAAPLTKVQLDCAVTKAAPGLPDKLATAYVTRNRQAMSPLREQLGKIIGQCVRQNRLSDAQGEAYEDYALARLTSNGLSGQLAKAGISMAKVDAALAGGGGAGALDAAGFSPEKLSRAVADRLEAYADLSVRLQQYRAALQ
jgi:hypothetical protein